MSNSAQNTQNNTINSQNQANNPQVSQSFRDQKTLQTFIKSSPLIKIIEGVAENYIKTFQESKRSEDTLAALLVRLPFNYTDFLTHDAVDLLHTAVEEPLQFETAAKYAVYSILRDLVKASSSQSGLKTVDVEQVHLQLRFIGLPVQEELIFDHSAHNYRTGLSHFIGILSAFTPVEKKVLQSVWFCATGCARNKIKAESADAPNCNSCMRPMSEYTKLRVIQSECRLRVLPPAAVTTPRATHRVFRALTVRLKDYAHDCILSLGSCYLITGYYNYYNNSQDFQAWNLIEHQAPNPLPSSAV